MSPAGTLGASAPKRFLGRPMLLGGADHENHVMTVEQPGDGCHSGWQDPTVTRMGGWEWTSRRGWCDPHGQTLLLRECDRFGLSRRRIDIGTEHKHRIASVLEPTHEVANGLRQGHHRAAHRAAIQQLALRRRWRIP